MSEELFSRLMKNEAEYFKKSFNLNLQKLQQDGVLAFEINSPDSWIEEAIKLINTGQNNRALTCLEQASYLSPIVNRDGMSSLTHHNNAKIYYFIAIIFFNKQQNYDLAMSLFEKANKLDPNLKIPDKIKEKYNEYLSNRSGVSVKMIAPLNASNLRDLFPIRDKILVSTYGFAEANLRSILENKITHYSWKTHILLSDYGLAFRGDTPICDQPETYVPWPWINYDTKKRKFTIIYSIGGVHPIVYLYADSNPHPKSGEGKYEYIDELNIKHLIEVVEEEMLARTVIRLKNLNSLPSFSEYIKRFEKVTKPIFKSAKKTIKKTKGKR